MEDLHNHDDSEQRSETCPTCALLDAGEDHHEAAQEEPEAPTAGRPTVSLEDRDSDDVYVAATGSRTLEDRDVMPDEPEAPEPTELPTVKKRVAVGEVGMISLDEILDDPNDNVARGCETIDLTTPKMQRFIASLATGQDHPILVRPIPGDGSKRYRLIFGFRRLAAARTLKWKEIEAKVIEATDEEAILRNWSEGSRQDPDAYALSVGIKDAVARGISTATIAEYMGTKQDRVDVLLRIMTKCPPELIEMFSRDCSQRMIDALDEIASIDADSPEDLRNLQLQHWGEARERDAATAQALEEARLERERRKAGGRKKPQRRMISFISVGQIGDKIAEATEWYDSETGQYNPISEETKTFLNEFVKSIKRGSKITVR